MPAPGCQATFKNSLPLTGVLKKYIALLQVIGQL